MPSGCEEIGSKCVNEAWNFRNDSDASGDLGIAPPPMSMATNHSAISAGTPSRVHAALSMFLLTESNARVISQNVEKRGDPESCAAVSMLRTCRIADSVPRPGRKPCCSEARMLCFSQAAWLLRSGSCGRTHRGLPHLDGELASELPRRT
jgi:hypothetical protein